MHEIITQRTASTISLLTYIALSTDPTAEDPTEHHKDLLGLKQIVHSPPNFRLHLESVPMHNRPCSKRHVRKLRMAAVEALNPNLEL